MKVQRGQTTAVPSPAPRAPPAAPAKSAEVKGGWAAKGARAAQPAFKSGGTHAVPRPGVRSAVFEAQLDRDTQSRSLAGNKVSMLFDGVNSFAERNKMIDGAK